ncbi:efflux RND transporter periplasmic adaptor subunit [Oleiharenicola sp. Vm1]|uniref:efflux RND transporter periplasmic adaptor subunit n=1 Tax=Oleiharenicola sp. Vm1 TaxID=3398393 RepID=UPI0039F4C90F
MKAKTSGSRWPLRIGLVIVFLAALVWGVGFLMRPVALVAPAERGTAVNTVQGTVEVKAEFANELKSEVGGRVLASALDVGKRVFRGDVLVQLDTGDIDLEIERIKNEIAAAKRKVEVGSTLRADVLNMRDTVANYARQAEAGVYPQVELEKQRRLLQQLEQRMDLDEVNLKLSLQTLENSLRSKERERTKMTVIAPADGVVTAVLARVGDLIGGNTPIATVMATTRTVEAKLSEEKFATVKVGQKASVRFLTYGADQYNAVVSKILPSADSATQRYTVFLDVSLPEGRVLVPGLTGEVSIIISERKNAVLIPRRALIGDYVYVVNGSRLQRRKVEKGYEGLNQVEITKGLQTDELVVVEEQDRFRDGDSVRTQAVRTQQ